MVASVQGVPVRLRDLATVEDTSRRVTRIVRVHGRPGLQLAVTRQSGKNTVEVARAVREELVRIHRDLPQLRLTPIIDNSEFIERSISNVGTSALYGSLFTVLVLLFFLRRFRPTAIIAVAIPVSVVASFALIYFAGFTLNIMTLGGLALGIGMLVDSSIVVLENIVRLRDSGRPVEQAAVDGAEEVGSAVLASTLTTVAVFLPLVYVRGMAGELFKQMALVVSFSLLGSLAAALTLVPTLASRYLDRPVSRPHASWFSALSEASARGFAAVEIRYRRLLAWALHHRILVLGTAGSLFLGSLFVGRMVGVELLPQTDEGEVRIEAEMEVGTRLGQTDETLRRIEAIVLREVPELKSMVTLVGGGFGPVSGASHRGQLRVALKPQKERIRSSEQVAADLRRKLSGIPGVVVRTRSGTGLVTRMLLRGLGGGGERVQVEVRGYDLEMADRLAEQVRRAVETVPGITDVQVSRTPGRPETLMKIDRDRAADQKLTVASVASALQTALGGTVAGYYREGGNEYRILVQLENAERLTLEDILDLVLINGAGKPVVLRHILQPVAHRGPVSIQRLDRERIVTVSANIAERDLGSILEDIRRRLSSIPVPAEFRLRLSGEYEEQQKTFRELAFGLLLALVLVYMVMVCLYESFRDPLVVMFSVPPAATGVIGMLALTGTTFNVQSFIGCIMLGGIVVNNAILLVDQINLLRRRDGMGQEDAIAEAGRRRLRPILMSSMTTVLALVPMALGMGEGGEFQAPLARAVIGGLVSSTLVTLVLVPVVYDLFERPLIGRAEAAPVGPLSGASSGHGASFRGSERDEGTP